jgi:hypothetical protein
MTRRDHPLATWLLGKRRKTPEIIATLPPYRELLAIPNGWSRSFIIEHLRGAVQRTVAKAIREGAMTRPLNCSECGVAGRIEAHHDDYDQPMAIRWLCRPCHRYFRSFWKWSNCRRSSFRSVMGREGCT